MIVTQEDGCTIISGTCGRQRRPNNIQAARHVGWEDGYFRREPLRAYPDEALNDAYDEAYQRGRKGLLDVQTRLKPTRTKAQAHWNKRKWNHRKAAMDRAAAIAAEPSDWEKIRAFDPDAEFAECGLARASYAVGLKRMKIEGPLPWVARMLHVASIDREAMDRADEAERAKLREFFQSLDKR